MLQILKVNEESGSHRLPLLTLGELAIEATHPTRWRGWRLRQQQHKIESKQPAVTLLWTVYKRDTYCTGFTVQSEAKASRRYATVLVSSRRCSLGMPANGTMYWQRMQRPGGHRCAGAWCCAQHLFVVFIGRKSNNGRRASKGTLLLFTAGGFPVQQPHCRCVDF